MLLCLAGCEGRWLWIRAPDKAVPGELALSVWNSRTGSLSQPTERWLLGGFALRSLKKCNVIYEENILVTVKYAKEGVFCLLEVRGGVCVCAAFLFIFVMKKQLKDYQAKSVDLGSFQGIPPPASARPDVALRSIICHVSFTVSSFQYVVTFRQQFCGFRGWLFFATN